MSKELPPEDNEYKDPYDNGEGFYENEFQDDLEIDNSGSSVSSSSAKGMAIIIGIILITSFLVYKVALQDDKTEDEIKAEQEAKTLPGAKEAEEDIADTAIAPVGKDEIPDITVTPTIVMPELPKLQPPPPPSEPALPSILSSTGPRLSLPEQKNPNITALLLDADNGQGGSGNPAAGLSPSQQALLTARGANNLISSGSGDAQEDNVGSLFDSSGAFEDIPESEAEKTEITRINNLYLTIAQGKMIDAVLETAINTDLQGKLRAVVSRDVYSEQGRNILIFKGSRMIGAYSSEVARGQVRVDVTWERIIRPDGVDIKIDSPATDSLGRSGVQGHVDDKLVEIFTNTLLLSSVTTGVALIAEEVTGSSGITTTENTSGSQDTSGSVTDFAIADATGNIGDVVSDYIEGAVSVEPTITVDQGTRMKVYVSKDLIFTESSINNKGFLK
jgi:type IV secretion system protein VirB10